MPSDDWRPLYARFDPERAKDYDTLHEGVPPWMAASLQTWVEEQINQRSYSGTSLAGQCLREIERKLSVQLPWQNGNRGALYDLVHRANGDHELFLALVDHLLSRMSVYATGKEKETIDELARILTEARSAWKVASNSARGNYGLVRRMLPETEAIMNIATARRDRAADYLRQSWQRAFGRAANPDGAYRDAIRALEASLKPIVSPKDDKATLGRLIRELRANPHNFVAHLEPKGPSAVIGFTTALEMLWTAQLDRHGTDDESIPLNVSLEQARDAAVLAASLVAIVCSNGLRRANG